MALIHFYICKANGEELKFDLRADARVLELKDAVFSNWRVPPMCQKFVFGTDVLKCKDHQKLSEVFDADTVMLTTILDASSLVTQLESASVGKRVSALEGLADLGRRIGTCVQNTEDDEEGNQRNTVVSIVCRLLEGDEDARVRRAAAHAASRITTSDDEETIEALTRRSNDEQDPSVHKAVMIALGTLAGECTSRVFETAEGHLRHEDASIRRKGLTALSSVAKKGDSRSVAAAREMLGDPDSSVRWEALATLLALTLNSDETTIAEIAKSRNDKCCFVRGQAQAVLQHLRPEEHLPTSAVESSEFKRSGQGLAMPMEARSESQRQTSTIIGGEAKDAEKFSFKEKMTSPGREECQKGARISECQSNAPSLAKVQASSPHASCCNFRSEIYCCSGIVEMIRSRRQSVA